MPDVVLMDITLTIPTTVEVAGDMPGRWTNGLVNNAEIINDRRVAAVPDSGTFQSRVAAPSSVGFSPMVDSAFVSKKGLSATNIIRKQYKNLAANYDKWNDKLNQMFQTVDGIIAKRFKDQVVNNESNWARGVSRTTLRSTGDRIRGLYAPQLLYWMTGDPKAHQMTNALTITTGAPTDFTEAGLASAFKAACMQKFTQALIIILNADFDATEITAQNTVLTALGNAFASATYKPFVVAATAVDSRLEFEYTDPTLTLNARIVEV